MTEEKKTPLELVLEAKEEDIKTFIGVLKDSGVKDSDEEEIVVDSPIFKTQRSGYIEIEHGWHKADYIWHIKPWHPKKQFRVTLGRALYMIAMVLNSTIPSTVKVDVMPPSKDWDIPEITFKANGLRDCWQVKDESIEAATKELFETLNSLL
jgi:hypothetical protein